MSHIKGENRNQLILFPESIDEYITDDNEVRFIDAFVNNLDMKDFIHATPKHTGRPPYDPRILLKLYIYGYLNKIRSSRKLEKETHRNIELFWLLEKLHPDFKTIADFRRNNQKAIKKVFKEFTLICLKLKLFGGELIAVDGSKFAAVNSKDKAFGKKKLAEKLVEIDHKIEEYLLEIDKNDNNETNIHKPNKEELEKNIKSLEDKRNKYFELMKKLDESGETQICITDPDSRLMRTQGGGRDVCYNIQLAGDSLHGLVIDYEISNNENDSNELSNISIKAKETLEVESIEVLADKGYYNNAEIKKCIDNGITPYVPRAKAVNNGYYPKNLFKYDEDKDVYICPNNCELSYRKNRVDKGERYKIYQGKTCNDCPLKPNCTKNKKGRMVERWEFEENITKMEVRLEQNKEKYNKRKSIIEHVFGIIKRSFDQDYLLLKGFEKVETEFSLTLLAFNMRRAINIVGMQKLMKVMA